MRRPSSAPCGTGYIFPPTLYLPKNCSTPGAAVLVRTPYGKKAAVIYYRYVQRGYAVVVQDVRSRNASEGEWLPNYHEVEDGDDTLNWIAAQPWCSGRIGMVGGSYLGYVQWAAAAAATPPESSDQRSLRGQLALGSAPSGWVFHLGHAGLGLRCLRKPSTLS